MPWGGLLCYSLVTLCYPLFSECQDCIFLTCFLLLFDTTPRSLATNTNRDGLRRVMGISPPRGSLAAAPIACVCGWAEVSLSPAWSSRNSGCLLPLLSGRTDPLAPCLAVVYGGFPPRAVVARPPSSLAPFTGRAGCCICIAGYSVVKEPQERFRKKPPSLLSRKSGGVDRDFFVNCM